MKTHLLPALLLACCLLFASSCSKKEDPVAPAPVTPTPAGPDYSKVILGKWETSSTTTITTNTDTGESTTRTTNVSYGDNGEIFSAKTIEFFFGKSSVGSQPYVLAGNMYSLQDGSQRVYEIISISPTTFVRKNISKTGNITMVATTTLVR